MFVICWGIISPWYEEIKLIKVTSVIKHRNMAKEIMIYTDKVYSLLLKLEKKQSIILLSLYTAARLTTPTSLLNCVQIISQWEVTRIWWLWRSMNIRQNSENLLKFQEFICTEILVYDFNNFTCITSPYVIILEFVQIP